MNICARLLISFFVEVTLLEDLSYIPLQSDFVVGK